MCCYHPRITMPIKYGDIAKAPKGALHSSVALCLQRDTSIFVLAKNI